MLLYIVRHGIAVPHGTPGVTEFERPLTPEGVKKVKAIGRGLRTLEIKLDRIVTSPLARALKTAEGLAEELDAVSLVETSDALQASHSAESIRDWLGSRSEEGLMIVGHNPSLSDLVALLACGRSDLPFCELRKGGVAALHGAPGASMTLDWLARPKLLQALGG